MMIICHESNRYHPKKHDPYSPIIIIIKIQQQKILKRFITPVISINVHNHLYFNLLLFVLLSIHIIPVHSFTIVRLPSPSPSLVSSRTTSRTTSSTTSIMGIKGFRSWFESQFPNAIVEVPIHYTSSNKNDKNYNKKDPITKNKSRQKDDGKNNKNETGSSTNTNNNAEYFDHVLIDMNQLLHQVMRKSKSDEHGLTLLIKELDNILIHIARPKQSLVLAIDGSPSAAKLATQRLRRYSNVYKNQLKVNQYTKLLSISDIIKKQNNNNNSMSEIATTNESNVKATTEDNNNYNNVNNHKKKTSIHTKRTIFQKKRRAIAETRTLCITPGTEFMKKTEQALMYWAWQRLSSRSSNVLLLSDDYNYNILNSIDVYISPSTVPGEGEVKILEWIYNHIPNKKNKNTKVMNNNNNIDNDNNNNNNNNNSMSIAILGGDSDLVLESLMIPLSCTHNVFVLLPDGNKRYLAVNIWETTRSLDQLLAKQKSLKQQNYNKNNNNMKTPLPIPISSSTTNHNNVIPCQSTSLTNMMNIRCDLALLLILNGNDYLPKLRGSSGFNLLFHTYINLQRQWFAMNHNNKNNVDSSFLYKPNTLEFNIDFCIEYFTRLDNATPKRTKWAISNTNSATTAADNALSNEMSISSPIQILHNMVQGGELPSPIRYEIIRETQNLIMDDINDDELDDNVIDDDDDNDEDGSDENSDRVLIRVELGQPGTEEYYTTEIWHPKDVPLKIARKKLAEIVLKELVYGANDDDDDDNNDDEDDDEEDDEMNNSGSGGITNSGFEWEIKQRVEGKVDRYLYGLLWNVQTYQDGICADYSFNYGKRLAPSANDIVQYFQNVKNQQQMNNNKTNKTTISMNELSNGRTFSPPVSAGISCLAALPSLVKYLVPIPYRYLSDETVEGIYSSCMDHIDNYFDIVKFEKLCMEQIQLLPPLSGNNNNDDINIDNDHYWSVMSKVHIPLNRPFEPPIPFADGFSKLRPNNRIKLHRINALNTPKLRPSLVDDHGPAFVNIKNVDQVQSYKIAYKKKQDDSKHRHIDTVQYNATNTKTKHIVPATTTKLEELVDEMVNTGLVITSASIEKTSKKKRNSSKIVPNSEPQPVDEPLTPQTDLSVTTATTATTTTDGQSAMAVLKQLADASLIGEIKWENGVSSSLRSNEERIRLIVEKPPMDSKFPHLLDKNLVLEHDRVMNKVPKKIVQQHLCSLALDNIAGSSIIWTSMSYKEFRSNITMNASTNNF